MCPPWCCCLFVLLGVSSEQNQSPTLSGSEQYCPFLPCPAERVFSAILPYYCRGTGPSLVSKAKNMVLAVLQLALTLGLSWLFFWLIPLILCLVPELLSGDNPWLWSWPSSCVVTTILHCDQLLMLWLRSSSWCTPWLHGFDSISRMLLESSCYPDISLVSPSSNFDPFLNAAPSVSRFKP